MLVELKIVEGRIPEINKGAGDNPVLFILPSRNDCIAGFLPARRKKREDEPTWFAGLLRHSNLIMSSAIPCLSGEVEPDHLHSIAKSKNF